MILIYASRKPAKLDGNLIKPKDFSGKPALGAKLVYTDNAKIKEAYENVGIEVKPIKG